MPRCKEGSIAWLLSDLPDLEAEVFSLYVFHHKSQRWIARKIGRSKSGISRILVRAVRRSHTYDLGLLLENRNKY